MIVEDYEININTMALLPAKEIEYDTLVLETKREVFVRTPPLKLIKKACFNDWSTYEGRRQAVMYHTNFKRKVPIPINIRKGIYFFPTHSPVDIGNYWISYKHVYQISNNSTDTFNSPSTILTFYNGKKVDISISLHALKRQMERTFECINKIEFNSLVRF